MLLPLLLPALPVSSAFLANAPCLRPPRCLLHPLQQAQLTWTHLGPHRPRQVRAAQLGCTTHQLDDARPVPWRPAARPAWGAWRAPLCLPLGRPPQPQLLGLVPRGLCPRMRRCTGTWPTQRPPAPHPQHRLWSPPPPLPLSTGMFPTRLPPPQPALPVLQLQLPPPFRTCPCMGMLLIHQPQPAQPQPAQPQPQPQQLQRKRHTRRTRTSPSPPLHHRHSMETFLAMPPSLPLPLRPAQRHHLLPHNERRRFQLSLPPPTSTTRQNRKPQLQPLPQPQPRPRPRPRPQRSTSTHMSMTPSCCHPNHHTRLRYPMRYPYLCSTFCHTNRPGRLLHSTSLASRSFQSTNR